MHLVNGFPDPPSKIEQIIARIGWATFILLFVASYTANLAAWFSRPKPGDYYRSIDEVIEEGKTAGDFDPLLDVAIARRLLFGGLEQVVTSWVLSRRNYSLVEVLEPLFTMLARAMGASSDSIKTILDAQREPESV